MPAAGIAAYELVQFVHVATAIAGLGAVFAYPIFTRAARQRGARELAYLLANQERVGKFVATPALLVLFATGIVMTIDNDLWSFGDGWINASMTLVILLILSGPLVLSRLGDRALESAEADVRAAGDAAAAAISEGTDTAVGRLAIAERTAALIVLVIVFLMVTKPF